MSLKNIIKKSIASTMTLSLLFGNCSLCGVGISQVIAENLAAPEVDFEIVNEKYVQYRKEIKIEDIGEGEETEGQTEEQTEPKEILGVVIESNLAIYSNQNQDTYMPTENVLIGINLPRINDTLPEMAVVAEASTKATTGEELNKNINQNYDSNSGLLTITYENLPNQEGYIYSEFVENARDEFKIIYTYSEGAYTENEEINLEYDVNVGMNFKAENETLTSTTSDTREITEKDNRGDISTFSITEQKETIYKGFMYSNVENKTDYDTEFTTVSTFAVLNTELLDDTIEMSLLEENEFVLDDEETIIDATGKVAYKSTKMSRYEFDKIIGQGYIEIYSDDAVISTVKYLDINEESKLCLVAADGQVEILEGSEDDINITYPANITNLKFKMSKPVTEGYMHFENKNAIIGVQNYGCDVKEIKYIAMGTKIDTTDRYTEMELVEPKTKVEINSSNINFSTLQANKTTLTVKLDDTNPSVKLFNNPTITITLPEGVAAGKLSSPEILDGNGLKIKEATSDRNVITLKLEGKQTSYDLKNIKGGTTIVMDIVNLIYDNTMPTHSDKISLTCVQGKETVKAECDVNIVSKSGLLIMSKLSNYNQENGTIITIGGNSKTVQISDVEGKEVINTLNLVNNHDTNLTEVQIIGRLDYSSDKLKTTFATTIAKPVEVNDRNVKVYYSTNIDADYEDESWTQEYNENAKSIKIVLNKNEIATLASKEVNVHLNIPANLGFNQENYIKWDVGYRHEGKYKRYETTVGMLTEKNNLIIDGTDPKPEQGENEGDNTGDNTGDVETPSNNKIEVKLGTYGQDYGPEMEGTIEYNAGSTVQYLITVKNLTESKLNNIKVEHAGEGIFDEGILKYIKGGITEFVRFEGYVIKEEIFSSNNNFEYTIKSLKANEEIQFIVTYTVGKLDSVYSAEVTTEVTANVDGETYKSNDKKINLLQSAFEISMTSNVSEEKVLKVGDSIIYTINVNNIGKRTGEARVEDIIPEQIQVNKIEYGKVDGELQTIKPSDSNVKVTLIIEEGRTGVVKITGTVIEQEVEEKTVVDITNTAKILTASGEFVSNEIKVKVEYDVAKTENGEGEGTGKQESEAVPPTNIEDTVISGGTGGGEGNQKPDDTQQQPDNNEGNDGNQNQNPDPDPNPDQGQEQKPDDTEQQPEETYSISGYVWLDKNKDGMIEENEKIQENIKVTLVNKDIGNFALDKDGNRIITTTDNAGKYTFNNIPKGNYLVLFEFDTTKYTVTTYRKDGVEENKNSDVVLTNVTIDGTQKLAAVTEAIELTSNKEDINLGLMENAIFDLSLTKQITEIIVKNAKGTETYEYEDGDTAKVDLVAKYMKGAKLKIKYKFTIINEGEVTGYVESLLDEIPDGLEFDEDLNENWTKGNDGKLYYTALSGTGIKPGESTEVELVLTKTMTEESTGVFPNSAKLEKISNLENIQEKEDAMDNNQSSAMLIISIKTGTIFMYIGLTLLCTSIILTGTYLIKKKVLNVGI